MLLYIYISISPSVRGSHIDKMGVRHDYPSSFLNVTIPQWLFTDL